MVMVMNHISTVGEKRLTAGELIAEVVKLPYQQQAVVLGLDHGLTHEKPLVYWHLHRDEPLPDRWVLQLREEEKLNAKP